MPDNRKAGDEAWWTDRLFRSVTLYPWATMDAEAELRQLVERGVNTVFVVTKESDGRVFYDSAVAPNQAQSRDLLSDLVDAGSALDIRIVPVIYVLCDKYLIEQYPETVQIAQDGTEIRYPNVSSEYMQWVCPRHDVVRDHQQAIVDELLAYDIDGIQFTHLEFQPIRNGEASYYSCFCDRCVAEYESRDIGDGSDAWVEMRCESIIDLLAELAAPIRDRNDLLANVELEAFVDLETAMEDSRKVLGVDQRELAALVDILTPRTAHVELDIHPLWIRDTIRSLGDEIETPFVPSVRTAKSETPHGHIPDDELVTAIQMAIHGGAQGVSLHSAGANPGRITSDQWSVASRMFEELAQFERNHGPATE